MCKITFHLADLLYPPFYTVIPLSTAFQNDLGCPFYEQIFLLIILSDDGHSLSTRIKRIFDLDFVFLSLGLVLNSHFSEESQKRNLSS